MDTSRVVDLNAFVPSKDFDLSKRFYSDLGFSLVWGNDKIAQFQIGAFRFLLQGNFFVKQHAENFMMSLMVEDADEWWDHIERTRLKEKYSLYMAKPPVMQPWGIRVLYLSDPTGVLWHIADNKKS